MFLAGATPTNDPCEACSLATLAAAQTQDRNEADLQVAATSTIVAANAQATLSSVNATVGAVQTQEKANADRIAAEVTATAVVAQANVQATLNSSSATQGAAMTQDAIQKTQIVAQATIDAQATMGQQTQQALVAGTQTAVQGQIVLVTQIAVATLQREAAQARLSQEQEQGSAIFLWTWCMPGFILLLGGLFLVGSWRWARSEQEYKRNLENLANRSRLPQVRIIDHRQDDSAPYLESHVVDRRNYQLTKPDDQVHKWLDEVKDDLINNNEKKEEENENTDNGT
jgi:hypothetical protein